MSHLSFVYLYDGLGPQAGELSAYAASIIQRKFKKRFHGHRGVSYATIKAPNTKNFGLKNIVPLPIQDVLNSEILDKYILYIR